MTELPAPRLIEPAAVPRLRWGVVGIGSIAQLFTRAVQAHTHQRICRAAGVCVMEAMWTRYLPQSDIISQLLAGVYPLSFASSVIGKPSRIVANGALTSTGVDARAAIALTTPGGANALIATSMVSSLPVRATIVGSAGRIDVPSPFFGPTGAFASSALVHTASAADGRRPMLA